MTGNCRNFHQLKILGADSNIIVILFQNRPVMTWSSKSKQRFYNYEIFVKILFLMRIYHFKVFYNKFYENNLN